LDILELDIEILVHGMKLASQCHIVLELHRHFLSLKLLEERVEELVGRVGGRNTG